MNCTVSNDLEELKAKYKSLNEIFHLGDVKKELTSLDEKIGSPDFWNDPKNAAKVQQRRSECAETIKVFDQLESDLNDIQEFAPLAEQGDEAIAKEVKTKLDRVHKTMDELEFRRLFEGALAHS